MEFTFTLCLEEKSTRKSPPLEIILVIYSLTLIPISCKVLPMHQFHTLNLAHNSVKLAQFSSFPPLSFL